MNFISKYFGPLGSVLALMVSYNEVCEPQATHETETRDTTDLAASTREFDEIAGDVVLMIQSDPIDIPQLRYEEF